MTVPGSRREPRLNHPLGTRLDRAPIPAQPIDTDRRRFPSVAGRANTRNARPADKGERYAGEYRAGLGAGLDRAAIISASARLQTAPNGLSNGLIWPKAGCASIAYGATAASNFLPLPAAPSFLAGQQSPP